jgi:hypothetical protein
MQLTYNLTNKEVEKIRILINESDSYVQRLIRKSKSLFFPISIHLLLTIVFWILFISFILLSETVLEFFGKQFMEVIRVFVLLLLGLAFPWVRKMVLRKNEESRFVEEKIVKPMSIIVSNDGIETNSHLTSDKVIMRNQSFRWEEIENIICVEGFGYVLFSKKARVLIPFRAFETKEAYECFQQLSAKKQIPISDEPPQVL